MSENQNSSQTRNLQAYQVFCALKYICVNDPFDNLFVTVNDLSAKTGIPVNTVKEIVESLVDVGWAQYDNPEKTDISCTKAGHNINNINMFSARFEVPHNK
jgi:predicted transcriptional regulator